MPRWFAAALTAAALAWAAVIVVAPLALHSHAFAVPAAVVYAGSSRICHQRPERSFAIAGAQMPVCARCAGLYVSSAVGALLGAIPAVSALGRKRHAPRTLLFLAAIPTAITWGLEFAGVMPFSNATRLVAALPLGAVAGWLVVRMLRYDSRLG